MKRSNAGNNKGQKVSLQNRKAKQQGAKKIPKVTVKRNSNIIDGITFSFSAFLLIACAAGAYYTGTEASLGQDFVHILVSPAPLVTDYFSLGSLPAALLNAGLCGLTMAFFMFFLPGPSHTNTLAGFFLVIAHCFYGLNFLNMWPCFIAPFLYLTVKQLDYNENLHVCMFSTCFSPFVSELLFRYTLGDSFSIIRVTLTVRGVLLTVLFSLIIAFCTPALLPGARTWHKGYNLYNGGLACGVFAFLLYSFLYRTVGVSEPRVPMTVNPVYASFGNSYHLFGNVFFLILFGCCLFFGWLLNGRSFRGIRHLYRDTGYQSNFAARYGMPLCLINIGLYGALFLAYINLALLFTEGAGFTGPTFGVIFAAITFTAMGQHVRNVWPILAGYPLLSLLSTLFNHLVGGNAVWTISTQAYLNSAAFATGLCPIVGRYGAAAGIAAGMLCAALCTSTNALHGGLMLYNGGFTAGITALILLPILENYIPGPRNSMNQHIDLSDMLTLKDTPRIPRAKRKKDS